MLPRFVIVVVLMLIKAQGQCYKTFFFVTDTGKIGVTTVSIMALSIMTVSITILNITDLNTLSTLNVIMLSIVQMSVKCYAGCLSTEYRVAYCCDLIKISQSVCPWPSLIFEIKLLPFSQMLNQADKLYNLFHQWLVL